MKKILFTSVIIIIIGSLCFFNLRSQRPGSPPLPLYIAHAGGGINGHQYTNAKEALDSGVQKGFQFFELDFHWTSDQELVLIHDWEDTFDRYFTGQAVPALEKFKKLEMKHGYHQLWLDSLIQWMEENRNTYIVTDVKENNLLGLQVIRSRYPDMLHRFYPQIYSYEEYGIVKKMGYENVILTLYKMNPSMEELLEFARDKKPYAVTMWADIALKTELPQKLRKLQIPVFAHTVNDKKRWEALRDKGVQGIYTDDLP